MVRAYQPPMAAASPTFQGRSGRLIPSRTTSPMPRSVRVAEVRAASSVASLRLTTS